MTGWYWRKHIMNGWYWRKHIMNGWYWKRKKLLVCTDGTKYDFTIWYRGKQYLEISERWTVPPKCLSVQHSYQVLPATNYSLLTTNYSSIAYTGSVQDSFSIISSVITEAPCILMSQGCLPKVFQTYSCTLSLTVFPYTIQWTP